MGDIKIPHYNKWGNKMKNDETKNHVIEHVTKSTIVNEIIDNYNDKMMHEMIDFCMCEMNESIDVSMEKQLLTHEQIGAIKKITLLIDNFLFHDIDATINKMKQMDTNEFC